MTAQTPTPACLRRAPYALLTAFLALTAIGCASSEPRTSQMAPPSEDELPEITFPQSMFPVSVGVIGADRTKPRVVIVPDFKPAEPTPEEQKILDTAPKTKPPRDFLALYPGPPSPTVNYLADAGPAVGVNRDKGGPSTYRVGPPVKAGTFTEPGLMVGEGPKKEYVAMRSTPKGEVAAQGPELRDLTGVNVPRTRAGVIPRVERD